MVEVNEAETLTTADFTSDGKISPVGDPIHVIGDLVVRFQYDALGRLIMAQRVHSGGPPNPAYRTEHYFYDGVRRIQTTDDMGTVSMADDQTRHEYVYGPEYVDEFVLQSKRTVVGEQVVQKPFYMLQDGNYNVMALLDDTGAVVEQYQWEPYGALATLDTTASPRPDNSVGHQGLFFYRFDGADSLSLNALGLYYNRNRWYSPGLGRFTSRDPNETAQLVAGVAGMQGLQPGIEVDAFDADGHFADGANFFAYLGTNPVDHVDPLGLESSQFDSDIDQAIMGIQADHAVAYATTRVAIGEIKKGNQLAMAYAAAAFMWDQVVWNEGEAALLSVVLGAMGANACFVEGTLVLMADGTSQPIEDVSVGDEVACDLNPAANDGPEACRVVRLFERHTEVLLAITVASDVGVSTITTTLEHPFYVMDHSSFLPAYLLRDGDCIAGPLGAGELIVTRAVHKQRAKVYNIEVEGAHNYYVSGEGGRCWCLAHNACAGHHTVPNMILKRLRAAKNAAYKVVVGARGRPNIWKIPEALHKLIHRGKGGRGGNYNNRFIEELERLCGKRWDSKATAQQVLRIRDKLAREFGLERWRPGRPKR